jgi:Dolichyl-phosphate-mannose-protein mannosyltransferase
VRFWQAITRAEKILIVVFLCTLPFIQPQVRGDGIGYYAYVRSMLINHNLSFDGDWKNPNTMDEVVAGYENGHIVWSHYTKIGHRVDHFASGPAMLWSPFIAAAHVGVLAADRMGAHVAADGWSRPYLAALAIATSFYGFLGLWFSFQLARAYFDESFALVATFAIWFASSLPAYMYVDPSWAHADSVFASAIFLWYWHRTLVRRSVLQWAILGALAGLMLDVYYANFVFLIAPLAESALELWKNWRESGRTIGALQKFVANNLVLAAMAFVVFIPTLVTRQIIFGNPLGMGLYTQEHWNWDHPAFWGILFSLKRGLAVWTPVLIPAIAGLFLLPKRDKRLGGIFLGVAAAYFALIAAYPWWDGISSFGSRYFITLTPLYVMGLTAAIAAIVSHWRESRAAMRRVVVVTAILIIWNLGLLYQWSTGLLPINGPVSWQEIVYNQFRVVPGDLPHSLYSQLLGGRSTK